MSDPTPDTATLRESIAVELARHQGLRGPMDDERPDVWQNRCDCGWDDGDERPGWRERFRLHIADTLLAGPLAELLRDAERVNAVRALADSWTRYPQPSEERERNRYGAAMQDCGEAIRRTLGDES